MSALVRPAMAADAEGICALLHTKMNARIPLQRWRQLMTYPWLANKPDFGRVVESDGKILGYCGMVYADRMIGDKTVGLREQRIVSMSSWYLDKSLRGRGLGKAMLVSALENPELSYATLTNSAKPLGIVEAIGFKKLETQRFVWRKSDQDSNAGSALNIIKEAQQIRPRVEPYQQKMLDDMRKFALSPVLMESTGGQALLFLSIKHKDADVLWYDVMYTSDPAVLVDGAQSLANRLLPDTPAVLAVDGRFVGSRPADASREELPVARYYYGDRAAPNEIDNLYSELQLLDLKLD